MEKGKVKKIARDLEKAISKIAEKYDCDSFYGGGKFDYFNFVAKVTFQDKENKTIEKGGKISDDEIRNGYAVVGTPVIVSHSGEKAIVTKVLRVKYVIKMNGKLYKILFAGCESINKG